jgi:hypothetical protein
VLGKVRSITKTQAESFGCSHDISGRRGRRRARQRLRRNRESCSDRA